MKLQKPIESITITPNLVKGMFYIFFLISISVYAVFFDRGLKLEYKEICPCDSHYTLYQYRDKGTIWNRNEEFGGNFKTFKLENLYGITVDEQININFSKINDTANSRKKASGYNSIIWNCDRKEVNITGNYKLSFK